MAKKNVSLEFFKSPCTIQKIYDPVLKRLTLKDGLGRQTSLECGINGRTWSSQDESFYIHTSIEFFSHTPSWTNEIESGQSQNG